MRCNALRSISFISSEIVCCPSPAQRSTQVAHEEVCFVIAHGPGIKLLYGLAEASTTGDTTYAYRCRVRFLRPHPGQYWTRSQQWKVPHCYCLAAGQLGYSSSGKGMLPV